jgi:hypothetical protein
MFLVLCHTSVFHATVKLMLGTGDWNAGMLECWNAGMLECWDAGMLECWNAGILECWELDDWMGG